MAVGGPIPLMLLHLTAAGIHVLHSITHIVCKPISKLGKSVPKFDHESL